MKGGWGRNPMPREANSDVRTCSSCGTNYHSGRILDEKHAPDCQRVAAVLQRHAEIAARPLYVEGEGEGQSTTPIRKQGRCEHCGAPTAGGRLAPGHDAKLKAELKQKAQDPDSHRRAVEAYAELYVRGWPLPAAHDDVIDQATALASDQHIDAWLNTRNESRAVSPNQEATK